MEKGHKTNKVLTVLLIIGTITVFFPLYMAVIIAFKKPSEMTNDVAGALALPKNWSFSNFTEAMQVTDFWHSLGNSLLLCRDMSITILIHSIAGYVIGRGMRRIKGFKFIYFYIVSGMFCTISISDDAAGKADWCRWEFETALVLSCCICILYGPMNVLSIQ